MVVLNRLAKRSGGRIDKGIQILYGMNDIGSQIEESAKNSERLDGRQERSTNQRDLDGIVTEKYHSSHRAASFHKPSSPSIRNGERGLVSNLRHASKETLGYSKITESDQLREIAKILGIKVPHHLEVYNRSIIEQGDGDHKYELDPTSYSIVTYSKKGNIVDVIQIAKDGKDQRIFPILESRVVSYLDDFNGRLPNIVEQYTMDENGDWVNSNIDVEYFGDEFFTLIFDNKMFLIPNERTIERGGVTYIKIGQGDKRNPDYVKLSDFGFYLGRDNKKPDKKLTPEEIEFRHTDARKFVDGLVREENIIPKPDYLQKKVKSVGGYPSYKRHVVRERIAREGARDKRTDLNSAWKVRKKNPWYALRSQAQGMRIGGLLWNVPPPTPIYVTKGEKTIRTFDRETLYEPRGLSIRILNDSQLRELKDRVGFEREGITYGSTLESIFMGMQAGGFDREVEEVLQTRIVEEITMAALSDAIRDSNPGRRIFLHTIDELQFMRDRRPSLDYAMRVAESPDDEKPRVSYSNEVILAQVKTDLSRMLLTTDKAITHGYASAGVVQSKYRTLLRIFTMLGDSNSILRLNSVLTPNPGEEMDLADKLIAMKSLGLNYLSTKPEFIGPRATIALEYSDKLTWINNMMDSALGDNYINSILFGSYARQLLGVSDKDPNDYDFIILVKDYETAAHALKGRKMQHEGKDVNIVMMPADSYNRLMNINSNGIIVLHEGITTNGYEYMAVPTKWLIEEGPIYSVAARHNILKGVTAHLEEFMGAVGSKPELWASFAKTPLLNMESMLTARNGWYVEREYLERKYNELLSSSGVINPMDIADRREKIITSHFLSSRLIGMYCSGSDFFQI